MLPGPRTVRDRLVTLKSPRRDIVESGVVKEAIGIGEGKREKAFVFVRMYRGKLPWWCMGITVII